MIPDLDPNTGYLPVGGRFPCTETDIERRFVSHPDFSTSATRQAIWSDWQAVRVFMTQAVPVHAVWFGGSFVTSKQDPEDLDLAFVLDQDAVNSLDPVTFAQVETLTSGGRGRAIHGLKIDAYSVPWTCIARPTSQDLAHDPYFRMRGHWDDWWMRARTGPKGDPPKPEDATHRRGYLEVRYV